MSNRQEHHFEDGVLLLHGEALEVLKTIESNSIDSVVTDPPYGLSNTKPAQVADVLKEWVTGDDTVVPEGKGFMGKAWDGFVPPPAVWKECMRVLKPGGHMAVFSGARTQDLMGLSIRLAGFEIRDTLGWIYGSGFPKSHNISKAIDKSSGAEREVVGTYMGASNIGKKDEGKWGYGTTGDSNKGADRTVNITTPATDDAKKWDGWGTALKPAIEPIILARKPIEGTVANNVLSHGVGGLNIDACRVPSDVSIPSHHGTSGAAGVTMGKYRDYVPGSETAASVENVQTAGRFPANVLLDEHAAKEMDKQSGVSVSRVRKHRDSHEAKESTAAYGDYGVAAYDRGTSDEGGASRFFPVFKYQAKAPKKERPVVEREDGSKIQHPTVKPVALMEWLVNLITPPGGTVLDPFTGSGTTLEAAKAEGFESIGIEMGEEYVLLVEERFRKRRERLEDDE